MNGRCVESECVTSQTSNNSHQSHQNSHQGNHNNQQDSFPNQIIPVQDILPLTLSG